MPKWLKNTIVLMIFIFGILLVPVAIGLAVQYNSWWVLLGFILLAVFIIVGTMQYTSQIMKWSW